MKIEYYLLSAGLVIGLGLTAIAYPFFKHVAVERALPESAKFESLEHLRASIEAAPTKDTGDSLPLRSILTPNDNDLIIYELKRSLDVVFQGAAVRTNAHGFRGEETRAIKDPNTFRIAVLGDSFTFGWGVEEEEAFPEVLERELSKSRAEKVEVLNFGVPGYSTFQQVKKFEEKWINFNPDAVLVFMVENDFGLPFYIRNLEDGSLVRGESLDQFDDTNEESKAQSQRKEIERWLDPSRSLLHLWKICHKKGIPLFVTANPNPSAPSVRKRLWLLRKKKEGLHYIALRKPILARIEAEGIAPKDLSLPDDPHPSPLKHRLLGELLAEKMQNFL